MEKFSQINLGSALLSISVLAGFVASIVLIIRIVFSAVKTISSKEGK